MTQEEKQLVLIDLCARLPYGNTEIKVTEPTNDIMGEVFVGKHVCSTVDIEDFILGKYIVRPYLRSMSSMTEEEYYEFRKISGLRKDGEYFSNHLPEWGNSIITERVMVRTIDWLNSHYFDYRGLIPMGLALEAPKDMYKIE